MRTNYETFEYEIEHMTGPCLCGTPSCRGRITGYRDLPEDRKAAFGPYILEYLREIDAGLVGPTRVESPAFAGARAE